MCNMEFKIFMKSLNLLKKEILSKKKKFMVTAGFEPAPFRTSA